MTRFSVTQLTVFGLAVAAGLAMTSGAPLAQNTETAQTKVDVPAEAPESAEPPQAIVERVCQGCHALEVVSQTGRQPAEWAAIIQRMRANGSVMTDDEANQVQAYLAKTYTSAQ